MANLINPYAQYKGRYAPFSDLISDYIGQRRETKGTQEKFILEALLKQIPTSAERRTEATRVSEETELSKIKTGSPAFLKFVSKIKNPRAQTMLAQRYVGQFSSKEGRKQAEGLMKPYITEPSKVKITAKNKILKKVMTQGFDSLTTGERKIYDEVIKKQPNILMTLETLNKQLAGRGKPKVTKPKYKVGDIRVIGEITYKRTKDGQWLPQ